MYLKLCLDFCKNISFVELYGIRKEKFEVIILLIILLIFIIWKIYEVVYYTGNDFLNIKNQVQNYVQDCNELNDHIDELRSTYIGINQLDYGKSVYYDNSNY